MKPLVLAHRGASSYAPENTVPAFDRALEMGADGIETDVRATQDGELVLLHDPSVDRTTNGSGVIESLKWAQVSRLDAGGWFAPEYQGARVPLLSAFLKRYAERTKLAVEVKAQGIARQVRDEVEPYVGPNLTVTSFDMATLLALKQLLPELRLGWLVRAFGPQNIDLVAKMGLIQICPRADLVSAELVDRAHANGLEVRAWAVRDALLMRQAVAAGVDGMTVNFPDKLVAYMAKRHMI